KQNLDAGGTRVVTDERMECLSQQRTIREHRGGVPQTWSERRQQVRLDQEPRRLRRHPCGEQEQQPVGRGEEMTNRDAKQPEVERETGGAAAGDAERQASGDVDETGSAGRLCK